MASGAKYSNIDEEKRERRRFGRPEPYRQGTHLQPMSKNCYFYKDGDTNFSAVRICVNPRRYKKIDTLISDLSQKVKGLPYGVRSIFTPRGRNMITSLDSLENNESYVCSTKRHMAQGVDVNRVVAPRRWHYAKPSSGSKDYNALLQEVELEDRARYVLRHNRERDQRMAYAYTRAQSKKITVIGNGDTTKRHILLINRHTARTFEQIMREVSKLFEFAVRRLYTIEGRMIKNLTGLFNGPDVLVAAGTEPFRQMVGFVYEPSPPPKSRFDYSPSRNVSRMDNDFRRSRMESRQAAHFKKKIERNMKTRGNWKIFITTSELPTAGTNAQVFVTVYGHKNNSGPIPLGFPDNKSFQPGQVDEYDLKLGKDIGEIYKIRISHDNSGEFPGWFCEEIRMLDEDTNETLVFPCRRWLSRDEDDHEICRELPAVRRGEPHLPIIKYEVTVVTGDLWNGGTESNVYLTIYGDRGDSGVRQLYVADKSQAFSKGQTNHFTIEAVSLGHLKRVIVGHDGTVPGDGWYLERLSIQEPDAKPHEVYHFYCGKWLDEGEDDGKIVRELKVQDEYMDDILEKRNWEYEKWKFESKNRVMFVSMLTGKFMRIKGDSTVDALGEVDDPGSVFICSSKKPMVRIFTSLLNANYHLAIDHGKVTGQGRGGPQCEFRIHVQSDRTVMLEGAKSPLQFITFEENGKLGDSRSVLDKDPAKRFVVYAKGVLRHRGILLLRTSNTQALSVDHDKSVYATGRLNRAAHFRVHKVAEGGIRMFESMIYPGFYLRMKDGKLDCNGSRNEDSHFLVEKHKDKGYFTLQLHKQRGMYVGFTPRGTVRPTVDSGTNNVHVYPEVVEYGISKQQLTEEKLTPISEREGYNETPYSHRSTDTKPPKLEVEEGDYRILVSTSETLEQGKVALVVYGDKGSSGQIMLAGPVDSGPLFKAGNSDEFKINLATVGKIYKVRFELIPRSVNRSPEWKVQKLMMTDMMTEEKLVFNFDRWLSTERDDGELMREMPVVRPGQEDQSLPLVTYIVTVFTGKDPGSETEAEMYINLFGDFGDCGKRMLRKSNRPKKFQRGQADVFEIEAVHLGALNKIQIGHDETKPGDGCFLDKVVVREGKTANMEFVFPVSRWFDSGMEDRKLERIIFVQEPAPKPITPKVQVLPPIGQSNLENYEVTVVTGARSGLGMEDKVLLYLFGANGSSGPITLADAETGFFKPGAKEYIKVRVEPDVGHLYKVRIGLAEQVFGCEWFLERLKLKNLIYDQFFDFQVDRWLSRQKDDFDVWRELPVQSLDEPPLPVNKYNIEVHTGDITGANTEAAVFINMIGQRGDSGKRRLYATQTDGKIFSQGKIDRFTLEAVSLGDLKAVIVGHSEKSPGQGWYLDYVAISEQNSLDPEKEFFFPCDHWLDTGKEDGIIERELLPGKRPSKQSQSNGEFKMWITTADDSQPSYGGKAVLVVYGDKGCSEEIQLFAPNSTAKLFEPGNADEFEVSTGDIGEIYKIRMSREDKPEWRAWHLEEVKLEDKATGEVYIFTFNRWFSRDMEDGDLSRELPVVAAGKDLLTVKCYEVKVTTGDHWAAETDANVYLNLIGSNGDSGKRLLHKTKKKANKKFQQGTDDTFTIEAVDLEDLTSVKVSHDGEGPGAGWFLEHITVTEVGGASRELAVFPCGRWLDSGQDDGKIERELKVMSLPQKMSQTNSMPTDTDGEWRVVVRTSDFDGADTRAQIYLTVVGTKDSSHPIPLGTGSANMTDFLPGRESEFNVMISDVGEITKIRLEHDGRNSDPAWHVDWVQLHHKDSGFDALFTVNRWLSEDHEDGQLFRECAMESPGWMPPPLMRYLILIRTGRKPNEGGHGGVCSINLIGSQGDTGQQLLSHPLSSSAECMKEGSLDVYALEAVSVGEIQNVRLVFEGKGKAKTWYVESVKVMEGLWALSESVFVSKCWLDDQDNSAVTLDLTETSVGTSLPNGIERALLGHHTPQSKGSWDVWVWTGPQESAGTTDPVHLVLYGTSGPSKPVHLNKDIPLRTGSTLQTKIEAGNIGQIFKIRLFFPEKTGNSSWFLERIKIKDCDTKQEFSFSYNNWIQTSETNLNGIVELPAVRPDLAPLSYKKYSIKVTTGDLPCAETSAEVSLMLIGQWGDSGQRILTKPINNKDPFRRGQTDEFEIKMLNLGKIPKIFLGHSEHGRGQGWFCDQVVVASADQKGSKSETIFSCNRWFDTGVDDRSTQREITATGNIAMKDVVPASTRAASGGVWTCHVKMALEEKLDASHASHGASHQVSLVLYGTKGAVGPIELGEGQPEKFAPGQVSSFKGHNFGQIGEFTKVRVSSGIEDDPSATWIIEEVILEDEMTKEKLHFDFSSNVGEVGGDVRKERPVLRPGQMVPAIVKYTVRVDTEDMEGAGTAAKVYTTLYGSKGDSGRRLLHTKNGPVPFKHGQKSQFEIEAVDLGDLEKLVLTKGAGDPWLLNQAVVKAGEFGPVEHVFIWSNWIGNAEDRNREVEITLPVISTRPSTVAVPTNEFPDFPITRGQWSVETVTGQEGRQGDATDVVVVFCGTKAESAPVKLIPNTGSPYQPGATDRMEIVLAEDVGELVKIRLGFEDNSVHKTLHMKRIAFEDKDTRDTFWFVLNGPLTVNDVSDGWKEFPVVWPGVFILPVINYKITVETGSDPEAGTQAQVMAKLDGQMGSSGFRLLKDTAAAQPKFQSGQRDTFEIEAVSLLNLDTLTIGHVNQNPGQGWFLNKVTVRPSDEEEDYVFMCNRWLDAGQDDGKTIRTLRLHDGDGNTIPPDTQRSQAVIPTPLAIVETPIEPERVEPLEAEEKPLTPAPARSPKPRTPQQEVKVETPPPEDKVETPKPAGNVYTVTTVTGDGAGHGTSTNLVLVLYGDKGHSEPLVLGEGQPFDLKEGISQEFEVETQQEDLGDLYKVRVGFESKGSELMWYNDINSAPSWFGEMMKLTHKSTSQEFFVPMKQWVRLEQDQDYWKEFPVEKENPRDTLPVRDYVVEVFTSQEIGAGTKGHVYLQLCGQQGDSGWRHLHGSRTDAENFESGSLDLFRIEAVDLGKLAKVCVRLDGNGSETWLLQKVQVKESEESDVAFVFDCHRWLKEAVPDEKLVELPLSDTIKEDKKEDLSVEEMRKEEEPPKEEKPKDGDWRIFTTTGDQDGATDDLVTLTVFGSKGNSGPLKLGEGSGVFQPGQTDQFDVWLEPDDIGDIQKIRLEHDNSGFSQGWKVDKVVMEHLMSGQKLEFNTNRWLSFQEKEGDIVIELPAQYPDKPPLKAVKYLVKVVTESKSGAGTQAAVYINIIGSHGDSGKRYLVNNVDGGNKFSEGSTNTFYVEAVDLGDLQKVTIGHNGPDSGLGDEAAWKLLCVIIRDTDSTSEESFVFPYGRWLTLNENEVTIPKGEMKEDLDDEYDHPLTKEQLPNGYREQEEQPFNNPPGGFA